MYPKTEWVDAGNRLELRDANERVLESEITRDGRCIHFDLSERRKTLKNACRQLLGLKPVYPPRVISTIYRTSEIGQARKEAAKKILEIKEKKLTPSACRMEKREIVRNFRTLYPRIKTRDC